MLHHTPDASPTKYCNKCQRYKPATTEWFSRDNRPNGDGWQSRCKECYAAYRAANKQRLKEHYRQYRIENRERLTEQSREDYRANKQKYAEQNRRYREANLEEDRARSRKWYAANREKALKYAKGRKYDAEKARLRKRKWRANNPEMSRIQIRRRRALKRRAEGEHNEIDIKRQYKAQKGKCYYCQMTAGADYQVDHVIPLSRGGSNDPSNLVIACRSCNASKRDKLPHEWPKGNRLL